MYRLHGVETSNVSYRRIFCRVQSSMELLPGKSFPKSISRYLVAKMGFDTAENEPCKVCPPSAARQRAQGGGGLAHAAHGLARAAPAAAGRRGGEPGPPRDASASGA